MARAVKVLKFGGTSMGSPEAMKQVIAVIRRQERGVRTAAVVVSAMSGVTDELIKIGLLASERKNHACARRIAALERRHIETARRLMSPRNRARVERDVRSLVRHLKEAVTGVRLVRELSAGAQDYLMSYGERLSARILAAALNDYGVACEYLDARKIVATDEHFGAATVDFQRTDRYVRRHFRAHKKLQIVTGFIASTRDKKTTTLGRGGSDYSAAIIGSALSARSIEIWTDVSGVMTADPRLVPGVRVIPELAFEEASELAYFGAKVLHPRTILPAMRKKIPVKVLNTFKPRDKGTTIVSNFAERRSKSHTVEALTFKKGVIVVHVHSPEFFDANGLMARIFEIFDEYRTSVDVVATSVAGVSLTTNNDAHLKRIVGALREFGMVTTEHGKAVICAVGGSVNAAGVAGRMFTVLGKHKIPAEMISQAAHGVSMTFVVRERDAEKALKVLHREYIR